MNAFAFEQCLACRHYCHNSDNRVSCRAYPGGIPIEIYAGAVLHNKPYQGDCGIRFTPRVEAFAPLFAAEYR